MDFKVNNEDAFMAVLWTLAIFLLPGVPEFARLVFISDKEAHFFFFFWASIIWSSLDRNYFKLAIALVILGWLIEYVQGWLPGRSLDMEDLMVDTIGMFVGFLFRIAFDIRFKALFKPFN